MNRRLRNRARALLAGTLMSAIGICALPATASADVWMWTDALGKTHFVDTARPIFTWVGDDGRVHFSDMPDHANAVAVQLVWHSSGSLDDLDENAETDPEALRAGETEIERQARQQAQAEYCQRVTEIHDSYKNAPRMYRTNEDGEREYLKKYEVRKAVREVAQVMKQACKPAA